MMPDSTEYVVHADGPCWCGHLGREHALEPPHPCLVEGCDVETDDYRGPCRGFWLAVLGTHIDAFNQECDRLNYVADSHNLQDAYNGICRSIGALKEVTEEARPSAILTHLEMVRKSLAVELTKRTHVDEKGRTDD